MTERYRVVEYKYHEASGVKLAHVGAFLMYNKLGYQNNNYKLKILQQKAKTAVKNKDSKASDVTLSNAMILFLLNTDESQWTQTILEENLTEKEAHELKLSKLHELKTSGYTTTTGRGVFHRQGLVPKQIRNQRNFTADNTTFVNFRKWCKKAVTGMNISEKMFSYILRNAYHLITCKDECGELSRADVWLMFNEMRE